MADVQMAGYAVPAVVTDFGNGAYRAGAVVVNGVQAVALRALEGLDYIFSPVLDRVCPRNPVNESRVFRFVPEWVEVLIGESSYADMCPTLNSQSSYRWAGEGRRGEIDTYANATRQIVETLKEVSHRPDFDWQSRIHMVGETNAYALPGGKMAITSAFWDAVENRHGEGVEITREDFDRAWDLIAANSPVLAGDDIEAKKERMWNTLQLLTSEEKVAGVMSHEMVHACASHGVRRLQLGMMIQAAGWTVRTGSSYFIRRSGQEEIDGVENEEEREEIHQRTGALVSAVDFVASLFFRVGGFFLSQHFSRANESEADLVGMDYLRATVNRGGNIQYRPEAAIWVQLMLAKKSHEHEHDGVLANAMKYFHSHPPSWERAAACMEKCAGFYDEDRIPA